jgi:hypothetical protein
MRKNLGTEEGDRRHREIGKQEACRRLRRKAQIEESKTLLRMDCYRADEPKWARIKWTGGVIPETAWRHGQSA